MLILCIFFTRIAFIVVFQSPIGLEFRSFLQKQVGIVLVILVTHIELSLTLYFLTQRLYCLGTLTLLYICSFS